MSILQIPYKNSNLKKKKKRNSNAQFKKYIKRRNKKIIGHKQTNKTKQKALLFPRFFSEIVTFTEEVLGFPTIQHHVLQQLPLKKL